MRTRVLLAALTLVAACSGAPGYPVDDHPDIDGAVTHLSGGGRAPLQIRVEASPGGVSRYDVAQISVTGQSRVYAMEDGRLARASADGLTVGTPVRVWFTDLILESYPVQTEARVLVIGQ